MIGALALIAGAGVPAAAVGGKAVGRGAPSGPGSEIVAVDHAGSLLHGRTLRSVLPQEGGGAVPDLTEEPPQLPGWPLQIASNRFYHPQRGVALADLTGDDRPEIIASSTAGLVGSGPDDQTGSGMDGSIHAWDHTATPLPGFPILTLGMAQSPPVIGDLDGDGDPEIVQGTRGEQSGGWIYAIDHRGDLLPGFPITLNYNMIDAGVALADLDGDATLEIIVGERAWPIGHLHVIDHDGRSWGGAWPLELDHVPTGTPAVGDVDGDGDPEIVALSYDSLYVVNSDGTTMPGWPRQIPGAKFSYQSPALADLEGDGTLEIVVGAHQAAAGTYVFRHDGTIVPGWPQLAGTNTYGPPAVVDLDEDGAFEIVNGRHGTAGSNPAIFAWGPDGEARPGFPYEVFSGGAAGPFTVARTAGTGTMIFGDSNLTTGGDGYLWGVDAQGNDLPGFPLRPRGFTFMNGATVGDVDGDGTYEIAVLSSIEAVVHVNLYTLRALGPAEVTGCEWPTYHLRNSRDGLRRPCAGAPAVPRLAYSGPRSAVRGEQVTLSARLVDADGFPAGGRLITFAMSGFEAEATTNPNGVASVDVALDRAYGSHELRMSFAGDDEAGHDPVETSIPFQVLWEHRFADGDREIRINTVTTELQFAAPGDVSEVKRVPDMSVEPLPTGHTLVGVDVADEDLILAGRFVVEREAFTALVRTSSNAYVLAGTP